MALITDGRFSGATHGFCVGHVAPEAFAGGPIALLKNGDRIRIDPVQHRLDCSADLSLRKASWQAPKPRFQHGVFGKYIREVSCASKGATSGFPDD